jgi:non-heme chloroperoxidase
VLYVVRPGFAAQAANLERNRPNTETAVFANAGHALFIDDAARFNALMESFIRRRIWP